MTETNSEAPYAPLRERLAPLCGVVVAVIAQVVMRDRIVLGPPYLAPVIETALVVVLVLGDGVLKAYRNRVGYVWYALALLLAGSATTSAVLLIHDVIHVRPASVHAARGGARDPRGPDRRVRAHVLAARPRRPQRSGTARRGTVLVLVHAGRDPRVLRPVRQLATALPRLPLRLETNLIAFSPTDTMPLTRTAKILMAWESAVSHRDVRRCARPCRHILNYPVRNAVSTPTSTNSGTRGSGTVSEGQAADRHGRRRAAGREPPDGRDSPHRSARQLDPESVHGPA